MSRLPSAALVLAIAAAALMFLPGTSVVAGAHPSQAITAAPLESASVATSPSPTSAHATGAVSPGLAAVDRLRTALTADHVPAQEQLLPSASPGVTVQNGMITPGSAFAPVPMGIGYYGITDQHGVNVASISYIHGLEGVLTLNKLNLQYLDSYGPDEFTAQQNSVAVDVTLQQNSSYQFWTQNVFYYYQSDSMLHLADAIVNFSSPALNVPYGALLTGNGFLDPGFGYFYPYGPSIYAPMPFTIAFFTNLSIVNNHPTVFFNYSVTSSGGTFAGSYDMVEFNSTTASPPAPAFQINGEALGDTGYIPNDVELILGGDGGGSTTSALGIQGTMNLYIENNGTTKFVPVPSAWDFGSETGETIEGVAEWASGGSNPTVHLGTGPSLQTPLWGVVGAPAFGHINLQFTVSPANAFVFASAGSTFNPNVADWAWVPVAGTVTYELPAGTYSFQILLSDYAPQTLNGIGAGTYVVTLSSDPCLGIYTPLWAVENSELAAISYSGGTGTVSNPYVLFNNGGWGGLNPLFGQYNDYGFPVFPGIQLERTNAYVTITHESSFRVQFTLASEQFYSKVWPSSNDLSYGFDEADHVSVVRNPSVGGWISYAAYGQASIVIWNSSHELVGANYFPDASVGMIMFGGTQNTIWGNVFGLSLPCAPDPAYIENYNNSVAMYLYESGDLIYNNYFGTPQTALTPGYNPYDFVAIPAVWIDRWNVSKQPATDVRVVNGFDLSGNILGLCYEGGNFWSNYGTSSDPFGVLPYNNAGNIIVGGDYLPLEYPHHHHHHWHH
jgi:thermopsin